MPRPTLILATTLCLGAVAACAPTTAINGFQAVDVKPKDIKAGVDSRSSVLSKLGSPSTSAMFDKDHWYYITQQTEKYAYYKPKVQKRDITEIIFDKGDKVVEVRELALKDGYQVAYDSRETPTRGREVNWVEQLLGTIGRGGGLLPQDQDPGQRPGQPGGR